MPPTDAFLAHDRALTKSRIENVSGWPSDPIHMKTYPWDGPQRFGLLYTSDLLSVRVRDQDCFTGKVETFGSLDDLLQTWTTD